MTVDLSNLNENQMIAVRWQDGPLLVLAGPGSGKTRVLTYRIARLIEETPNQHFRILGLTFTNKAAAEMRSRIEELAPNASDRTLLTTFHSFSADILRQHGNHLGLKPDFTILSQTNDRISLLDKAIADVISANETLTFTSESLLPLISRLTENDVAPDRAKDVLRSGKLKNSELYATVYERYRKLMIEQNALDFNGLIAEALSLLETNSGVRKHIQRIYPYVCVDEFQDTNLSQYKILKNLVNLDLKNLFVVADDDQIIYQWNGASPERLWDLRTEFDMELLQLPENYRCPSEVVELANNLISHNFSRPVEKYPLTAHRRAANESPFKLRKFRTFENEANWIAKDIASLSIDERAKCVILARARKLLESIVEILGKNNITGYLSTRKNEFSTAQLHWVHSILRLANARNNREHLRRVCKAFYSLERVDLNVEDIISWSTEEEGDYLRGWRHVVLNQTQLSAETREFISNSLPKLCDRLDIWGFQTDAFLWLDQLSKCSLESENLFCEYEEEKSTWNELVAEISNQYGAISLTLHQLIQELDLRSKEPPPPENSIPCFTIHASKGLEFDHVYLVGLVEDQLPSWSAKQKGDNSREMEEERRNCFVAITRAQETLNLSYSSSLFGRQKPPSRFLSEMGLL